VQLYEDFAKSQVKRGLEESVSNIDDDENEKKRSKDTPHIFQVGFRFLDFIAFIFKFSSSPSYIPLPFPLVIPAFTSFLFLPWQELSQDKLRVSAVFSLRLQRPRGFGSLRSKCSALEYV